MLFKIESLDGRTVFVNSNEIVKAIFHSREGKISSASIFFRDGSQLDATPICFSEKQISDIKKWLDHISSLEEKIMLKRAKWSLTCLRLKI